MQGNCSAISAGGSRNAQAIAAGFFALNDRHACDTLFSAEQSTADGRRQTMATKTPLGVIELENRRLKMGVRAYVLICRRTPIFLKFKEIV